MGATKICPCVDCGIELEVHKKHALSKVRCPTHREAYFASRSEHRKRQQQAAEKRYREKLKREGRKKRKPVHQCLCTLCGTSFKGRRPETKLCSPECVVAHNRNSLVDKLIIRKCVGCPTEVEVSWSVPSDRVRCGSCRETHRLKMKDRHRASRRNAKRVELGQVPYEDYVVVGPVWCSYSESYGWRVVAKHKSNSNRREMSLAHYNLSVKLGRRVQDREEVIFLDDDVDNCAPENLILKAEKKKEVA